MPDIYLSDLSNLDILYEDNHIIAVNKRVSDIVQGDKTGDTSLDTIVKEYIKQKYNKPGNVFLGVTHRIDRPVSGVVLYAKTSKSLTRLNAMFRDGEMDKTYWCIVKECPAEAHAILTHHLVRQPKNNVARVYDIPKPNSKEARLEYRLTGKSENYFKLEIKLFTGRHHQIRAQLAKIGCPIKGDLKYGFARSNNYPGIALHARSLSFMHPVQKEKVFIEAPTPEFEKLWDVF